MPNAPREGFKTAVAMAMGTYRLLADRFVQLTEMVNSGAAAADQLGAQSIREIKLEKGMVAVGVEHRRFEVVADKADVLVVMDANKKKVLVGNQDPHIK
ncbi:hypothetical protein BSKO_05541 [Bryopsis sp. KO-2023]|nr:hypothetical protein BSKO_05541 [Bryopsis sp. KO-2023]